MSPAASAALAYGSSAAAEPNQLREGIHDLAALCLLVYESVLNGTPHLRTI